MKKLPLILVTLVMLFLGCKKSKDARKLKRYLNDTTWEFYKAEDAAGNDITAQVLADSMICTQFTFLKTDSDAVTYNTLIKDCHNTYYIDYKGNWVVTDWTKIERKENIDRSSFSNSWKDFGVSIGNVGLENPNNYLNRIHIKLNKTQNIFEHRRYIRDSQGFDTEFIQEIRYYKKI